MKVEREFSFGMTLAAIAGLIFITLFATLAFGSDLPPPPPPPPHFPQHSYSYYQYYRGPMPSPYEPYSYGPSGCAPGFYWNGRECWID